MAKEKKVVRKRMKKGKENPIKAAIRLAVETGKVDFGSRKGLHNAFTSQAKAIVVAKNTPQEVRDRVLKNARATGVKIVEFEGSSMELGAVCGKPFPVAVLSIYDPGTSNILELAQ